MHEVDGPHRGLVGLALVHDAHGEGLVVVAYQDRGVVCALHAGQQVPLAVLDEQEGAEHGLLFEFLVVQHHGHELFPAPAGYVVDETYLPHPSDSPLH